MKLNTARALITGGAGGIGKAIAAELLRQGASVMLLDRDARSLQRAAEDLGIHGDRVATLTPDLTEAHQLLTSRAHELGALGGHGSARAGRAGVTRAS